MTEEQVGLAPIENDIDNLENEEKEIDDENNLESSLNNEQIMLAPTESNFIDLPPGYLNLSIYLSHIYLTHSTLRVSFVHHRLD